MVHAARGARWLPRDRISASVLPCRTRPCRGAGDPGPGRADAGRRHGDEWRAGSPRPQRHLVGGDSDAGRVLSLGDGAGRRWTEPPDLGGLRRRAVLGDWRGLAWRRSADRLAPSQTVATHHVTTGTNLASVRTALGHQSLATPSL